MKYLGCKKTKTKWINEAFADYFSINSLNSSNSLGFVEPFSGTGVVAESMIEKSPVLPENEFCISAEKGFYISDHYYPAYLLSKGRLYFYSCSRVEQEVLKNIVNRLNKEPKTSILSCFDTFFMYHYSEVISFFTKKQVIQILSLKHQINSINYCGALHHTSMKLEDVREFLLGLLLQSILTVANIRTGFDAVLSDHYYADADIMLSLPKVKIESKKIIVRQCNADKAIVQKSDVLYLDPPNSYKRYSRLYHVLDTLLLGKVLPVYTINSGYIQHAKAPISSWHNKKLAYNSLESILCRTQANYVSLSYLKKGLLPIENIENLLSQYCKQGKFERFELGNEWLYIGAKRNG